MAVGGHAAHLVEGTVSHFLRAGLDVVLFAYDDHDWAATSAAGWDSAIAAAAAAQARLGLAGPAPAPTYRLIQGAGEKYFLGKAHLPASALLATYSHLFFWDEDIVPNADFDAAAMLALLQRLPRVKAASPLVVAGCHVGCGVADRDHYAPHAQPLSPEMMAPVYRVADMWGCVTSLLKPEFPEAWGVDLETGSCLCNASVAHGELLYVAHMSVDHMNLATLSHNASLFNRDRAFTALHYYEAQVKRSPTAAACFAAAAPYLLGRHDSTKTSHVCFARAAGDTDASVFQRAPLVPWAPPKNKDKEAGKPKAA